MGKVEEKFVNTRYVKKTKKSNLQKQKKRGFRGSALTTENLNKIFASGE